MPNGKTLTAEQRFKLPWEGYDHKKRSDETGTENKEESLTQISQQEQSDINWIVRNFMPTAIPQNTRIPMEGDFTGITDYRTALEQIAAAEHSFMQMPAELRAKLGNDPQQFIEWCADPSNLDEMRKLGLAVPKKPDAQPAPEVKPKEPDKVPAPAG